jgi:hypothetical protein
MKPQTKFLQACAARTPIIKSNPVGDFIGAVSLAALFIVVNFI